MNQIQLINAVRIWERRLEIEHDLQVNAQKNSYSDSLAELERLRKEGKHIIPRFSKPKRDCQPAYHPCTQESFPETQGG